MVHGRFADGRVAGDENLAGGRMHGYRGDDVVAPATEERGLQEIAAPAVPGKITNI
jgi:hypothetical protein